MPYLCDIRSGAANNVIEVNNRLFIEGVEFTPTNLAPIAFSQGPTAWAGAAGAQTAYGLQAVGQLCLPRTYVRGDMGVYPAIGEAGQFDTSRILCGQDAESTSFVWSSTQSRFYGVAGYNISGYLSSFDQNFRVLSTGILASTTPYSVDARPGFVFLPSQNNRWITLIGASAFPSGFFPSGSGGTLGVLTEAGSFTAVWNPATRYVSTPYIGSDWVLAVGTPWYSIVADPNSTVSVVIATRNDGTLTTLNASWLLASTPPAIVGSFNAYLAVFPSNAVVETPGSQIYFYYPTMSSTALNVFIGTVSGLAGTPTLSAATTAYTTAMIAGVDTTNDWITTSGDIPNLSRVRFTTSSTFPAPLVAATDYWTIRVTATTSRIATSYANAVAGTYIDLTTQGTAGTLTTTAFATLNLDTSGVTIPANPGTTRRNVRAWVFENSGTKYLCIGIYEPGDGTSVPTNATNLYLWRLDSKTSATYLQKLDTGSGGRVRTFMTLDSSQKRIAVVYDDKIVFYQWNAATNWTFQSTQSINTQDVGVDSQGRVWATDIGTYQPGVPAGYLGQSLYVYEPAGAAANITVSFAQSAYSYTGATISSDVIVNAYDVTGARVALNVTLTRDTTNFDFSGNPSTAVTTSTSADTLVPISVFSTGLLSVLAVPT